MQFFRFSSARAVRRCAMGLLFGAPLVSQAQAAPDNEETQRNREAVSKAFAAWSAGGQTFFDDMLAPDVVWTIKGSSPTAGVHRGKQALIDKAVKPLSTRL